ncbi:hypothetical protein GCM10009609_10050 [Pseudonocardia aurantiaca]|uniref:Uncharacterized protein n=1 Tax=Pseudonocardia aurantiaca TaxID=75290 RepID=A0ABW4FCJ6_9PSEU
MPPSTVHFNGGVNLPDAETVLRSPNGCRLLDLHREILACHSHGAVGNQP